MTNTTTPSRRDLARHLGTVALDDVLAVSLADAAAALRRARVAVGFADRAAPLLSSPDDNVKLAKGEGSWGLSLLPASVSGWNVCRYSTSCADACVLLTAGKGGLASVRRGRQWKTDLLATEPAAFLRLLIAELAALPAGSLVRLNTASDLPWETIAPWLFPMFAGLRFYDYTKWTRRDPRPFPNYRLVFSVSERQTLAEAATIAREGGTPVVVVNVKRGAPLPTTLIAPDRRHVRVVDGDADDNRFADPDGVVVMLRAKGAAIGGPAGDAYFVKSI